MKILVIIIFLLVYLLQEHVGINFTSFLRVSLAFAKKNHELLTDYLRNLRMLLFTKNIKTLDRLLLGVKYVADV